MTDPGKQDMPQTPRFGVQILNFNGAHWLPGLLRSLEQSHYPDKIVFVVDNASTDDSLDVVRQSHPDVRIIQLGQTHGFAEAYNRAVPAAWADGCEWVCLLNNDTVVCDGWLEAAAAAGAAGASYGVLGPVHWSWDEDSPSAFMQARFGNQLARFEREPLACADVDWLEGSCLFVRQACWRDLGGLDVRYRFYWEDADFCRRAVRRGWKVGLVSRSHIRHYGGGSSRQQPPAHAPLKQRHFYLYKLSDPNRPFWRNSLAWLRLLVTELRAIAVGPRRWIAITRWTSDVIWMIRRRHIARAKWQGDRAYPSSSGAR